MVLPCETLGIAVHVRQGTLFIADDGGTMYELNLKRERSSDIWNEWEVGADLYVEKISIDWLFDRLYLLTRREGDDTWSIARSRLDGRDLVDVVTDLKQEPTHIEIDPFNG